MQGVDVAEPGTHSRRPALTRRSALRIGVYIDGYNLYYGGRALCGRGAAGWRWLDLRALAKGIAARHFVWSKATVDRVVYCTARISAASNPSGFRDQDIYLKALVAANSVDLIEYGVRDDYTNHQLPDPSGPYKKPQDW